MDFEISFLIHPEIADALKKRQPVVALESAVITHGLPEPVNLQLAEDMETVILSTGAIPATIAMIEGCIHVGLEKSELELIASDKRLHKISQRDFSIAISNRWSGGTTVAGTLFAANKAGIKVFATGGIGGVHRNAPFDVSADLNALSRTPMIVVCSGAKAILDLLATREILESNGVPILGYCTDILPSFFSAHSSLSVDARIDNPEEAVKVAINQWNLGLNAAILIVQPPPFELEVSGKTMDYLIQQGVKVAETQNIKGASLTPFLLQWIAKETGGESIKINLALLKNNARLAAQIAVALSAQR